MEKDINSEIMMEDKVLICLGKTLIQLARSVATKLQIHLEPEQIVISTLFFRSVSAFEAVVLLFDHGMMLEAGNSTRVLFEAYFILLKCVVDKDWAKEFIKSDLHSKATIINSHLKLREVSGESWVRDRKKMKERLEEIKSDIEEMGAERLVIQNIAESLGLDKKYHSDYRAFSMYFSHITPEALIQYTEIDDQNGIVAIREFPNAKINKNILLYAGEVFEKIIFEVIDVFSIDGNDFDKIKKRIAELVEQYKTLKKMPT